MPQEASLRDFILGYCQQVGGLVEQTTFGVDEVLLPDEVARRWGIEAFQRFTFGSSLTSGASYSEREASYSASLTPSPSPKGIGETVSNLYYGHPLVETIVTELRQQPADTRFYINPARLEKPGLRELVEKIGFQNARPTAGSVQRSRFYHYICFNFKASLVSDEKHELLVGVWMHLQGGYRLPSNEISTLIMLSVENAFPHMASSPPSWRVMKSDEDLLGRETLSELLDRARLASLDEIAPTLTLAQRRSQHFLDLDRARLNDYYNDLLHDLEKRISRAEEDRLPSLQTKLAALEVERQIKLEDAEQKYHLRLDLELINLAIIAQPKLEIDVEISKRGVKTTRIVAWDPVRHILEPLVCDVCNQPGEGLALCESGHLAHPNCLVAQCVDCKRTFCRLCSEKIHSCSVCGAPVCTHSLVHCQTCGKETCQNHTGLCHAAESQLKKIVLQPKTTTLPPVPSKEEPLKATQHYPTKPKEKPASAKTPPSMKPAKPARQPAAITAQRIQVEINSSAPWTVTAFALRKEREIAVREWELTEHGIYTHCFCEKGTDCKANHMAHRPTDAAGIEARLAGLIQDFAKEYGVTEKNITYFRMLLGEGYESPKFSLPLAWKDPEKLVKALKGFVKLFQK